MIRQPNHHRARQNGYILEHILVAEKMIGRRLRPGQPPCPCGRVAVAKGLCSRHYAQKRRTGKTWDLR
jgi:hypothetical protein